MDLLGRERKDQGRVSGLQFAHWGVGGAMLQVERLRSKASLTGRCFWWGSWIPKPAVAFPVQTLDSRATVENSDPELTAHYRPGAQRRRELGSESASGFRSELRPETGSLDPPVSGSFPCPITFPTHFVERRKDKGLEGEGGLPEVPESGAELAVHSDAPRGLEPL